MSITGNDQVIKKLAIHWAKPVTARPEPRIWLDNIGRNVVTESNMTKEEKDAYMEGWRNEEDRKDWG